MSAKAILSLALLAVTPWDPALADSMAGIPACNPSLLGNLDSPLAYQPRGNRCEGLYRLEVGGLQLRLDSLTEVFDDFDPSRDEALKISWSLPSEAEGRTIHLQANALLPRTFFRMDSAVRPPGKTFEWPTELLDRHDFRRDDLGVFGWFSPSKDEEHRVYLPLRVSHGARPKRSPRYELAITPRHRLQEVFVTVVPVDREGAPRKEAIWSRRALSYGHYLANTPIWIDLPALESSGYYRIDLQAKTALGGSLTSQLTLFHEESSP